MNMKKKYKEMVVSDAKAQLEILAKSNLEDDEMITIPPLLKLPIESGKKKIIKYVAVALGGVLATVGVQDMVLVETFTTATVEIIVAIGLTGIPLIGSFLREKNIRKHIFGF